MSAKPSPQDLFPNLFGAKPAARPSVKQAAADMRLVQYAMRQASKRLPTAEPPRPSRLAPVAAGQTQARPVAHPPAGARRATPTRPTSLPSSLANAAPPPRAAATPPRAAQR